MSQSKINIFLRSNFFYIYLADITTLFKIQKPAILSPFPYAWCPGGLTIAYPFFHYLFIILIDANLTASAANLAAHKLS